MRVEEMRESKGKGSKQGEEGEKVKQERQKERERERERERMPKSLIRYTPGQHKQASRTE